MIRKFESKPVTHAVFWIALYIAIVNIGDSLGGIPNLATSLLLTVFSMVLLFYTKTRISVGYDCFSKSNAKRTLYYLPLAALVGFGFRGVCGSALSF